jgi:hypothetical protein
MWQVCNPSTSAAETEAGRWRIEASLGLYSEILSQKNRTAEQQNNRNPKKTVLILFFSLLLFW